MAVELRPYTDADLEAVAEISTSWNRHFGIPIVDTAELFDEEFVEPVVHRETGIRLAIVEGQPVGYVYTYHLASDTHDQRCYVFARVLPEFLSRGVGSELSAWGLGHAKEILRAGANFGRRLIRTDAPTVDVDAQTIFANLGMSPVRWFAEMRAPLDDIPAPMTVDDYRLVRWNSVDSEELRRVKNDAFADHWGSTPDDELRWSHLTAGVAVRRDLSLAAVDESGAVVGLVLSNRFPDDDVEVGGNVERVGWIDKVATLRNWRKRGVASALIASAADLYRSEGLTHAGLYVDSDNPTGAVSVYERLGFRVTRQSVTFELVFD